MVIPETDSDLILPSTLKLFKDNLLILFLIINLSIAVINILSNP